MSLNERMFNKWYNALKNSAICVQTCQTKICTYLFGTLNDFFKYYNLDLLSSFTSLPCPTSLKENELQHRELCHKNQAGKTLRMQARSPNEPDERTPKGPKGERERDALHCHWHRLRHYLHPALLSPSLSIYSAARATGGSGSVGTPPERHQARTEGGRR